MLHFSRRQATQSLVLGTFAALTAKASQADTASSTKDALTIMEADPRFSDWIQILRFSGLTQYAQGSEKFTAFIPTNEAFVRYPYVLQTLLMGHTRAFPDTTRPVQFVRSHIIQDFHPLSEFTGRTTTVTALSGCPIRIDGSKPGTYSVVWKSIAYNIGEARVADAPIVTSNAIIYPIDNVVLVPGGTE